MSDSVKIPIELLNRKLLPPDALIQYIYALHKTKKEGKHRVDFFEVSAITGLSQQKISLNLNLLERLHLLDLERKSGKVYAEAMTGLPEIFKLRYDSALGEIQNKKEIKEINSKIKTSTL
jgi:DNA-binding transcriptional ArsR family regulator